MITLDHIYERVRQQPFVPFRIVTSSGMTYDIRHPDLVWIGERDFMVGTASSQSPGRYAQASRLAIIHVTALEDLPVPVSAAANGTP